MDNRRDDWHNSVDQRLVNLTSAQKSADDDLDEIQGELARIDRIIRGDPEDKLDGLIEAVHVMQTQVNKFNAMLNPDFAGHGGLINKIDSLLGKRERSEKREGYFWTFATAVVVQFLILTGLLIVNWDRIHEYIVLHEHIHQANAIEFTTKKLKAKRKRKLRAAAPVPEESQAAEPETTD